jgi:hypothetical protein
MTKETRLRVEHEAEGGAAGAVAGAILGAVAGPPGAIVGALLGAAAGALSGFVVDGDAAASDEKDAELDRQIGVSGGEMGVPNLEHPPATVGAYSGGAAGAPGADGEAPAEGPIQSPSS